MLLATVLCLFQDPTAPNCPPDFRACEELVDLDRMPLLKRGVRAYQASSFDRSGLNDDGFTGLHSFRSLDANGHFVIFDEEGPGVVNRMHFAFLDTVFTGGPYDDYTLSFFFDHEPVPRIAMHVKDFVSGHFRPFLNPMVLDDYLSPGGPLSCIPIAFRTHLKVTADLPVHYFDWQFFRYEEPEGIQTYDPRDAFRYRYGADIFKNVPADPKPPRLDEVRTTGHVPLQPGRTHPLLLTAGPGEIRELRLTPNRALTRDELRDLWVRITFDGAQTPQVEAPLGLFFGNELGTSTLESLLFGHDRNGTYYAYFPMPYAQDVVVELESRSHSTDLAIDYVVRFDRRTPRGEWAHFHATFQETGSPRFFEDIVLLECEGWGHFVGCSLAVGSDGWQGQRQVLTYLEGDERIYVDDSLTPQFHGTGTEEFFNWGWYEFPTARQFALPTHGYPERFIDGTRDYSMLYRSMHSDYVPFYRSLRVALEHGPLNEVPAVYRSVSYYYLRPTQVLVPNDSLDVGDPVEERLHLYRPHATSLVLPDHVDLYEGDWMYSWVVQDDGRQEAGPHSFQMSIDPTNHGLLLRRRTDQRLYDQAADVYVDGLRVGRWALHTWNVWFGWRDEEFQIPARFTAGKPKVQIRIVPTSPYWNAARYDLYSYQF